MSSAVHFVYVGWSLMRYRALLPLLPFVLLPATGLAQGLRISQVYGGGGNSGTFYKNDFIEIFNAGSSTVNLNGYSVQYNSAAGTGAWQATPLSGTIDPGKYYLIQEAAGTTTGGGTNP